MSVLSSIMCFYQHVQKWLKLNSNMITGITQSARKYITYVFIDFSEICFRDVQGFLSLTIFYFMQMRLKCGTVLVPHRQGVREAHITLTLTVWCFKQSACHCTSPSILRAVCRGKDRKIDGLEISVQVQLLLALFISSLFLCIWAGKSCCKRYYFFGFLSVHLSIEFL